MGKGEKGGSRRLASVRAAGGNDAVFARAGLVVVDIVLPGLAGCWFRKFEGGLLVLSLWNPLAVGAR